MPLYDTPDGLWETDMKIEQEGWTLIPEDQVAAVLAAASTDVDPVICPPCDCDEDD